MQPNANTEMTTADLPHRPRRFEFERDSFAFANELHWAYEFDRTTGETKFRKRDPAPTYGHRCFVVTRAARQFLYHARFDASLPRVSDAAFYRQRIREVVARSPREKCLPDDEVVFPGFASLREFSRTYEAVLKAECGGAWRSYVLRSHWRMVFPISREHQGRTAASLLQEIQRGASPIVHLVVFPKLTINHGMILFSADERTEEITFHAYDPNQPDKPTHLAFNRATQTFALPANQYWAGGPLNVIEIYRDWWM